jgi:hypothetical protein
MGEAMEMVVRVFGTARVIWFRIGAAMMVGIMVLVEE